MKMVHWLSVSLGFFLAFPTFVIAGEGWRDSCEKVGDQARYIMELWQQGELSLESILQEGDANQYTGRMIRDATNTSQYNNENEQHMAIVDFQNKYYLNCVKDNKYGNEIKDNVELEDDRENILIELQRKL